jgi:hypothetical protein
MQWLTILRQFKNTKFCITEQAALCRVQQVEKMGYIWSEDNYGCWHVHHQRVPLGPTEGAHIFASSLDHRLFILEIQIWTVHWSSVPGKFTAALSISFEFGCM